MGKDCALSLSLVRCLCVYCRCDPFSALQCGVLIVDSGNGMSQAGSADISSRAVFLSIVAWPMMLGIMTVMDQKDYCTFYWQWHVQGLVCWPLHLAMCSLTWGRYEPEGLFRVLHCCSHALCVQRQVPGYGVQKTADSLQLQPIHKVVDFPIVPQRLIPMIKLFSRPS